ncbi:MAG: uracil-DNA glycosylase, partial [Actinobacteria bacterium]|nr:uracil-DNA glycosylase [Actinomycetota bacterium]
MQRLPHPITGELYESPVPPGTGWPGDLARADTPVARDPDDVRRLAAEAGDATALDACVSVCRACPRRGAWGAAVG